MTASFKGEPRRILHVTPSFFPAHAYGGPVAALYELCRAQLAAGLEVRVLTSDTAGPGKGPKPRRRQRLHGLSGRWVHEHGVPTYYGRAVLGQDIAPELVWRLPALIRWADLIHVTGVWSPSSLLALGEAILGGGALRMTTRATGATRTRPCVLSPRGSLLPWAMQQGSEHKGLVLRLLSPLFRRVAGWHATSEEEVAALQELRQKNLIGDTAIIRRIANGITVGAVPTALPLPDYGPRPRIVVLGRVHPVKNLELAVAALVELRRTPPAKDATLLIVGPEPDPEGAELDSPLGGYGARLRAQAQAALGESAAQAVRFVGLVTGEAKQQLLRSADVLWLTSHMESFGNVVLEALAAGTQVVAAKTTPWRILPELGGGQWVAPSAATFAQATLAIVDEQQTPAARAAVAERCQAAARASFSWSNIELKMRALYADAMR